MTAVKSALSGITVLELCGERGHLMGKLMGDMGARIIKVEPTSGVAERLVGPYKDDEPHHDMSLYFWAHNTSKQSLSVDIESKEGKNILKDIASSADVLIEDFSPGYLPSLGLGFEMLSSLNPGLVMTSLTGFGQDGPYRDYKSSDIVSLAMGGIMHSCGYDDVPNTPPIRPSGDHGNKIASHYGLIGTLSALIHRDFTGRGQYIDASAHEACSSTTEAALPTYLYQEKVVFRQTGRHHGAVPTPKTLCKTSDNKYIIVFQLFNNLNSWLSLVKWMTAEGMAEDLGDERFKEMARHRTRTSEEADYAFEIVRKFVAAHTAEEIYRGAQALKFPWGTVRSPEENLEDPHFAIDRDMFPDIEHSEFGDGVTFRYAGTPYKFSGTPWSATRAPLLGEHTFSILSNDLGYSKAKIDTLLDRGTISVSKGFTCNS